MSINKSPSDNTGKRPTGFRLIPVEAGGAERQVEVGASVELVPGVVLRLADENGNAMVERTTNTAPDVWIANQPVYEVAHYRAMQELKIGSACLVLLPPYGVFARDTESRSDKVARLEAVLGSLQATDSTSKRKKTRTIIKLPVARSDMQTMQPLSNPPSAPHSKRTMLLLALLVPVAGLTALAVVPSKESKESTDARAIASEAQSTPRQMASDPALAALAAAPVAAQPAPAQVLPAPPAQPAPAAPAETTETAAVATNEMLASAPAKAQETYAEVSETATQTVAPPPALPAPERPEYQPTAAKPDKQRSAKPAKTSSASKEASRLNPQEEQAVREKIESYQLEAGFDPEGAVKKLKVLREGLPPKVKVRADIDKAIRAITN